MSSNAESIVTLKKIAAKKSLVSITNGDGVESVEVEHLPGFGPAMQAAKNVAKAHGMPPHQKIQLTDGSSW